MKRLALIVLILLAGCGQPNTAERATSMPYPTNAPATPGPTLTPAPAAYPAPYPAPLAVQSAAPPDPQLLAAWDGNGAASVSWTQSTRACLYVNHATGAQAFVGCWEGQGRARVSIGKVGPMDGSVRPAPGDVYLASIDGATYRAPLLWYRYLAVWRA